LLPPDTAPTTQLGVGLVLTPAGGGSPVPHHHGAAETAVYVLEGTVGFRCGQAFGDCVEAGPGKHVFIAPYAVHQEFNPDPSGPNVMVVVRDIHGTNFVPAEVPMSAADDRGVQLHGDDIAPSAGGAERVRAVVRTLAAGERGVIEPAGRETAVAVLAGVVRLDDAPTLVGQAGEWFYLSASAPIAVVSSGGEGARLLIVQGPPTA
jgi:uncharacterized RmlC-like cupin family protein